MNHIEFPLQSGKVNGPNGTRMVIVDTRYEVKKFLEPAMFCHLAALI